MDTLIRKWDGESVIVRFDRSAEAWIFIAIHSTRLGPAIGGTRMRSYADTKEALEDALRLAGGMTYKWAAAGMDAGGGKAVIAIPAELDPGARVDLLRRYGSLIGEHKGLFLTGPDLGTSSADMDIIAETGDPYVFARTPSAGGAGNPAPFTALGVLTSIQAAGERVFGDSALAGRTVLVQGAGSVGRELIDLLRRAGSEVLFSDVSESTIRRFRDELGLPFVPPDEVYDAPCDVFAPCAVGGILNQGTIQRLQCRVVVGAANNQLARPEDADTLRDRGILYGPDFISNSGGAIAIVGMETRGWSLEEARERLVRSIKSNLSQVFDLSDAQGISPDAAAGRLAETRLEGKPQD